MAIKIMCPHCKRGMLVPETLAGKKGKCKACQGILTVPQLAAPNGPPAQAAKPSAPPPAPAAAPAPPPAPADVEAEAAALFADEPKPTAPVEVKLIDLNCPYCDEAIQFPADLAGKRAPCPECKRVIKVPELVKKDPKDWRKVEARGPSGARLPDQPELEGAWGSTTARGVGKETLEQVGLLPKVERPRTLWQKVRLPVLGVSLVVVAIVGGLMGYRWWAHRAADRALAEALTFADTPEAPAPLKAAVALGAADYYLNSRTSHKNPPAVDAKNQLGKALTTLRSAAKGDERDALLGDLALALVELGGNKEEADKELRLSWDEVQKLLVPALAEISSVEARRQALRLVVRRLLERGESKRVLPLTNQVYPPSDPEKTADKAAALAVAGFELLRAGDNSSAQTAAETALGLFPKAPKDAKDAKDAKAKSPPLRAEVVALAQMFDGKKAPAADDNEDDKASEHIGKIMALARQGEWGEARKRASLKDYDAVTQLRAYLALAATAVDAKLPDTTDVEAAMKLAEGGLTNKPELSWSLLRLTQLALAKGLPQERVQALADQIGNTAVRGRAQLAIFRAQLAQAKQPVEDSAADKVEVRSVARALAAQALARHNTRVGANSAAVVQSWPQPLQAFGSLGIALGLVDREK